ncbi:GGDEF domain-containing protein [Sporolactobacillus shoreae]|uniref:GGDEF domain-containing protein n=2 Tax=Sporolactobacillus shoreae TaxID=1465501 RepID=A0A4Z0GPH9_9BACL|nr:GGDEF domain-containing protein [Sporolactobacillus shoreae]
MRTMQENRPMGQDFRPELDKIIKGRHIKTVFQPIVSLRSGNILGYEALSRVTCASPLSNSELLFREAGKCGRLWELDSLCRSITLHTIKDKYPEYRDRRLFLNINPVILNSDPFRFTFTRQYLRQFGIEPNQIVFEITERNSISDANQFIESITHFKSEEFYIAIDDAGSMYSGLNLINDIHPHYIKLDRRLIQDIDLGKLNFALIKGLIEFCRLSNIHLIAEGIETQSELMILMDLGVPYAQGYLLQKPEEQIKPAIDPVIKKLITDHNKWKNNTLGYSNTNSYISNICLPTETISKDMEVGEVWDKFKTNPDVSGFCVVEEGRAIGIVIKSNLALQISGRFGFSLYQNQPISRLMDTEFISVDYRMPINEVSGAAMARPQEKLYDFIVVHKKGSYLGTVTIKNLLEKATEIEVSEAKYENPLTGLPGNLVIEQKMKQCLSPRKTFGILYLDINHFKEYNDVYGFENGDCVIKLLANILLTHLPPGQFVGHVGGDDFVAILDKEDLTGFCSQVSTEFQEKVLEHYNSSDREKGYIITENRWGVIEKFALMTVAVAGISASGQDFATMIDLTEKLARLKKESKKLKDSNCLLIQA